MDNVVLRESIASLKITLIFLSRFTPVDALAGKIELIEGATVSAIGPVVKVHFCSSLRGFPEAPLILVVIDATNIVFGARSRAGENTAEYREQAIVPAIVTTPSCTKNDSDENVAASIASEKVTITFRLMATPISSAAGVLYATVGAPELATIGFEQ